MKTTVFTPAQRHAQKLDRMLEDMWNSGELDQKRLDEIDNTDLHQLHREQRNLIFSDKSIFLKSTSLG